ncbi:hypothetical protein DVH05_025664 [Phytophthora capsici]|nr:hypothetical protein DVH05_025664 [Phytophthora capsici]
MPYAEIEVMKMYMPLLTPEAGVIRLLKPEGAVLAPGDCIATMELDDPSCMKKSDVFMGKLPSSENTNGNRPSRARRHHTEDAGRPGPGGHAVIPLDAFAKITDKIQTFKKAVTEQPTAAHEFNVAEVVVILGEHKKMLDTDRKR